MGQECSYCNFKTRCVGIKSNPKILPNGNNFPAQGGDGSGLGHAHVLDLFGDNTKGMDLSMFSLRFQLVPTQSLLGAGQLQGWLQIQTNLQFMLREYGSCYAGAWKLELMKRSGLLDSITFCLLDLGLRHRPVNSRI